MENQTLCFVNKQARELKIEVANDESAKVLRSLLAKLAPADWELESEWLERMAAAPACEETRAKRLDQRGWNEYRVALIANGMSFRSGCAEVGESGLTLRVSAPESFRNEVCTAYLSHGDMDENIEFPCQFRATESALKELVFLEMSHESKQKWLSWILADATP